MATVSAPNKGFNGVRAGVRFVDGVGETVDENALNYFARHGYTIDDGDGLDELPATVSWETTKDPVDMTRDELLAYAADNEIDLHGATKKADILHMILVPGAPTDVTAAPGEEQVSVAWTAPDHTGTSAITGYQVEVSSGGEVLSVEDDDASPLVVSDLEADVEYSFRVRAVNDSGAGPWSDPDSATPTAPAG